MVISEGLVIDYKFLGVFGKITSFVEMHVVVCGFCVQLCVGCNYGWGLRYLER